MRWGKKRKGKSEAEACGLMAPWLKPDTQPFSLFATSSFNFMRENSFYESYKQPFILDIAS